MPLGNLSANGGAAEKGWCEDSGDDSTTEWGTFVWYYHPEELEGCGPLPTGTSDGENESDCFGFIQN